MNKVTLQTKRGQLKSETSVFLLLFNHEFSSFLSSLNFKCDNPTNQAGQTQDYRDHSKTIIAQRFQLAEVEISSSHQQGRPTVPGSPRRDEMRL